MGEKEAAKLLSVTAHQGFVVGGAENVFVEMLPGAHLTSPTGCPMTTPAPHGTGKIRFGTGAALTVTLHKFPGAVIGSEVRCDGAPAESNSVTTGAGTVKYGVTSTLGGYPVVEMEDGNVRVGNIVIEGTPEYIAKVLGDLATGLSNETGRAWFQGVQDTDHHVFIHMGDDPTSAKCGFDERDPDISNGRGTDADIEYNPDAYDRSPESTDPPDAGLYHELGHADHVMHGKYTPGPGNTQDNEEYNTMWGQGGGPSENAYRKARGFPQRKSHEGFITPRDSD
jgi:hypothetical protein